MLKPRLLLKLRLLLNPRLLLKPRLLRCLQRMSTPQPSYRRLHRKLKLARLALPGVDYRDFLTNKVSCGKLEFRTTQGLRESSMFTTQEGPTKAPLT